MIGLFVLAQLVVVAHAPDTAAACTPVEMTVAARVAGGVAPVIMAPLPTAAAQLLRSSVVSRVEPDGAGRLSAISEATFVFAISGAGRVQLPSATAVFGAQRVRATAPPVDVRAGTGSPPLVLVRASLGRAGVASTARDTLFVGQQVDYVVDVQLNDAARQRLRRNPTFFPPEMPGVLAYDIAPPTSPPPAGRRCFETLSYRRALFPLFAGRTAIAPATLTYSLPLSASFFSREESFELRTDSVHFVAREAPLAARPHDFAGAVGALRAVTRFSATRARMGDPVVITLRVSGTGNVKLWPRPSLVADWAAVAPGPERVQVDTAHATIGGAKEFDWVVTPHRAGAQQLAAIEYNYFDADREQYATARTAPLALDVASADLAAVDSVVAARLPIRRRIGEDAPPPITSRPWFWLLLALSPLPAATRRARDTRRNRTDRRSAARRLQDPGARRSAQPRALRRLFLDAVGERVSLRERQTSGDVLARQLRRAGVTEATAHAAAAMLDRLDAAAFSPTGLLREGEGDAAASIVRAIDAEAVAPTASSTAVRAMTLAVLLGGASVLAAAPPSGVLGAFDAGVRAYDAASYSAAQRLFARAAARAPRAASAWVNLGTSAWARADTAAAVRAWQRAVRLDPLDAEARERLQLVQPMRLRARAYVAPLPVNTLSWAALCCWVAAWIALAIPLARRPARVRALAGGAVAVSVALLGAALATGNRLDTSALAVLRSGRGLLDAPASATTLAAAGTGETGITGAREGVWVHFTVDEARAGWVPLASLLPLDTSPLDD